MTETPTYVFGDEEIPPAADTNITFVESVDVPDDHVVINKTTFNGLVLACCFLGGGWIGGLLAILT